MNAREIKSGEIKSGKIKSRGRQAASSTMVERSGFDAGLAGHMQRVYGYMGIGLALTALTAYFVSGNAMLMEAIHVSPLKWVVMLAPLGFAILFGFRLHALSPAMAKALFLAFSVTMGLGLSYIFVAYTGISIVRVFAISAATFFALSLYGYGTGRDLSGIGSFLIMGLVGILIASLVNLFLGSGALDFAVSVIGVLVFAGLTAYDTQKVKEIYLAGDGPEEAARKSIYGAFTLYLDFINMFLFLLRLFGNRQ